MKKLFLTAFLLASLCAFDLKAQIVNTSSSAPVLSTGGFPVNTKNVTPINNLASEILTWGSTSLVYYSRLSDAVGTTAPLDSGPNAFTQSISGSVTFGSTPLVLNSTNTSALFSSSGTIDTGSSSQTFFHSWDYTQPFHIEAIIEPNFNRSNGTTEIGTIFSKGTSTQGFFMFAAFDSHTTNTNVLELDICNACGGAAKLKAIGGTDLLNGKIYHVAVDYDGSGAIAGLTVWVNGKREAVGTLGTTLSSTIITSTDPFVGSTAGSSNYFKGNIQEVAVWNVSHPAGFDSNISTAETTAQDVMSWYHAGLQIGAAPAPANPPTKPNVIIEDDCSADIDGVQELVNAIWLHENNYINLIGYTINSADPYAASVVRAILNYNGLSSIPVYSWQGTGGGNDTLYTLSTAGNFRSQDATNVGILNSAVVTGGGTLNQVGDVLTVPGGTLASGFNAATMTVTSVSAGGVITGVRTSNSGSYSSAPSSPATLNNLHSGTQATITFSTANKRGNYTDPTSGWIDLLNNNSKVYILNSGNSYVMNAFLQNNSALIASKVAAYILEVGWWPSNTYLGKTPEANLTGSASQWYYIFTNWPSTVPMIACGDELTTAGGSSGLIYSGPADVNNSATDPVQYAFSTASTNGETFVSGYLRPAWTFPCLLYLSSGITTSGGNTYSQYLSWGATGGTGIVNSSTGANSFSNNWSNLTYMRIRTAYTTINSLLVTIMAAISPG